MKKLVYGIIVTLLLICAGCNSNHVTSSTSDANASTQDSTVMTASNAFEQYVLDGKYADALNAYHTDIQGNAGEEIVAIDFLNEYLDQSLSMYADGTISDTDIEIVFTTLQKINETLYIITDSLTRANDTYLSIASSKEYFEMGMDQMADEQYTEAMDSFYYVSELDTENYEAAQEQIANASNLFYEQTIEYVNDYITNGDYSGAIFLLEDAERVVGIQDEFEALLLEARTLSAESEISSFIEAENYVQAFDSYESYLESDAISFSAEFVQQMAEWKTDYRDNILQQAQAAADENDYTTAFNIIDSGLTAMENDESFLSYRSTLDAEYEDYLRRTTPISLVDIEPYQQGGKLRYSNSSVEDIFGNTYSTYITTSYFGSGEDGDTWRIDGIYQTFSGTIFIPSTNSKVEDYVSIYGDGVKLLDVTVHGGEDSIPFNLDVTGVRDLTVVLDGGAWGLYIGDPILTP